ncbi:iron-containing alcohol dehydrogenase [Lentibacillus sp. N15]|uniref:iron-containing alcohol dehydrogenase n=1 Tax=Lentibacillus songyuanensis TaxID=3136161 RepID=UPI0031BB8705
METYAYFQMPQRVHYGRGTFEKVGEEVQKKGRKALIISDKVMEQIGNVSACIDNLKSRQIDSEIYLGVESEPTDKYVEKALSLFKEKACDVIVSIGGGSCIDTAKAVAVLATNGGYIGDYMGGKKMASTDPIPHIAIPTTAGTGSEATDVTVIDNTSTHVKMMIKQPAFLPYAALVDPLLSKSSPKKVTAATGVDALSHAIEAYISRLSHPMTDTMALSAMKRITANLLAAYENGDNIDARENMSIGALQAGIAFSNASVCLVHGMSRPIGALFGIPHGFSNAMLLPAVLEYSKDDCIHRLADLGRIFSEKAETMPDEEAANVAVASVKELCTKLNIPNLKTWGVDQEQFEKAIPKMAEDAIDSGSPGNNPWSPTKEEIENLYRVCYDYQFETEQVK